MANVIEYTLSLQDKWSGVMRKIGIENDTQLKKWGAIQMKVVAASQTIRSCGVSVGSLRERVAALRAERDWIPASNIQAIRRTNQEITALERKVHRLETSVGGRLKMAFKNAFSSMPFGSMIMNPVLLAGVAAGAALKKGFEREKIQIAFEVLTGDKQIGDKLLGDIQKSNSAKLYGVAGLQENAKMMLGFGIATERIMPNLKMLGDIAGGDKEKLSSMTLAFSQMSSAGKLMGQDLLQMINAGFNPLNEISLKTGKSMSVLKQEMSDGKISSEMVRDAFVSATSAGGRFYGMTEKLGDSKSGKWATILNTATQLLWKLYDIIEPMLNPALNVLSWAVGIVGVGLDWLRKILKGCADGFKWWIDKFREGKPTIVFLTGLITTLGGTVLLVKGYMMAMAAWAWIVRNAKLAWASAQAKLNTVMALNPIVFVVAGIIALIGVIAYLCYKIDGWGSLWGGVVGFMKYSFYAFVDGVKLYFSTLINGIMIGLDYIKLGWYKFKEAVGIGDSTANRAAIASINADVEARQKAIVDGAKKVLDNANKARESLAGIKMSWNSDRSLAGIASGIKSKLGMSTPAVPGMDGDDGSDGGDGGNRAGSKAVESIATGGSRNTTINIHVGNMVESIYYQGEFGENRDQFENDLESAMMRVLQMAYTSQ